MRLTREALDGIMRLASEGRVIENGRPTISHEISEKEFMQAIIDEARRQGWMIYHTYDSRKSQAGFPDLVLVKGRRVIFAEVKTDKGTMSAAQRNWSDVLSDVGGNVRYFLWRPASWPMILEELNQ